MAGPCGVSKTQGAMFILATPATRQRDSSPCASHRLIAACAAAVLISVAGEASAAFTQAGCPYLWFDTPFSVDVGATDYNYDVNNATRYALREHHSWTLLVNSNVQVVRFGYQNFLTEANYDFLSVDTQYGPSLFTGNLGTNTYELWPKQSGSLKPNFQVTWHSDYSVNADGMPRFSTAEVRCFQTTQPTEQRGTIQLNTRYDGLMLKSGDVIYVQVTQQPNTRLWLTADVVAGAADADFDLYASTSCSLPDDSCFSWRDYRGNGSSTLDDAGASLTINPPVSQRTIYIGIHSYRGAGHFVLRANAANASQMAPNLIACSPGVNMQNSAALSNVKQTVGKTLLRTMALVHGNYQPTGWTFKQIPDNTDKWCNADSTCQICMTSPTADPDFCGYQSSGTRTRIPYHTCAGYNNPDGLSLILAHELGHSRFWEYPDEYNPWGVGNAWFCGHSIMNGPNPNSDKLCTGLNHCTEAGSGTIGPPGGYDCSSNGTAWKRVVNYLGSSSFISVPAEQTTVSSQPWRLFFRNNHARSDFAVTYQ